MNMSQIPKTEILFALAAFICIGLCDFFRKKGVSLSPSPVSYYTVEVLATFATIILLGYFLEGWKISLNQDTVIYASLSGILICVAMVAMLYGLRTGEATTVVPIARLSLALTVFLSIAFLGDAVTLKRIVGDRACNSGNIHAIHIVIR
jgi:transporter family protein